MCQQILIPISRRETIRQLYRTGHFLKLEPWRQLLRGKRPATHSELVGIMYPDPPEMIRQDLADVELALSHNPGFLVREKLLQHRDHLRAQLEGRR